jgi:hypothetical protein
VDHGERIRALEVVVADVRAAVQELDLQMNGPLPEGRHLRGRLHKLENRDAAIDASQAAVAAVTGAREAAKSRRERRLFAIAGIGLTLANVLIGIYR